MFRFGNKTRDIITLFHAPSLASSVRVLNFLKQTSAAASETASEDQASDHSAQNKFQRSDFDLEIKEDAPTKDQLRTILEYAGSARAASVVKSATSENDALKKFGEDEGKFIRPVVVDWSNGKAVIGENESAILKMLKTSS